MRTFAFEGVTVPGGAPVNYSSYVSHRLPDVWDEPHAFRPERFERRQDFPKGAYVPFGGGSRQCIGMRFGQLEIKAIAARILREHRLELEPGYRLEIRQTPTLGPKRGLPMRVVHFAIAVGCARNVTRRVPPCLHRTRRGQTWQTRCVSR